MGHTSTDTGVSQITDSHPFGAKREESASRQESKAKWGRQAVSFKFSFSVYLFILHFQNCKSFLFFHFKNIPSCNLKCAQQKKDLYTPIKMPRSYNKRILRIRKELSLESVPVTMPLTLSFSTSKRKQYQLPHRALMRRDIKKLVQPLAHTKRQLSTKC